MVRIKYFLQYCKIALLVLFALNKAADICHDNKPCQDRGGCFIIEETEQGFLSTYCVCVRGYSGRWCQFQDGIKADFVQRKQLIGRPGSPKILSQLPTNERSYILSWEKPSETALTPVLYYAVRYRIVGESKWTNVNEIFARETQTIYSRVLESLQWDVKYEVEIYAGSSQGVGRPATAIIHGPKIGYPEIVPSKEEITVVEDDPFFLSCDVRGEPRPSVSWTLNGKTISQGNIFIQRERLRVNSSNAEVQGVYRCVANNTWGTVMSRRIRVNVLARVRFTILLDPHTSRPITMYVKIGKPATFRCYPHTPRVISGAFYKWGNRYKNSIEDFNIKTSERVWITTDGTLVFSVFKQEDVDLFNKKGIRCIIEQKTMSGRIAQKVMSNVFRVAVKKHSGKQARHRFVFQDKPPKTITLLRGENLELHCSAISNSRGNIIIEWGIDTGKIKRFPNGIKVTSFSRVLKYDNVQKSDSGKITCKAFKLNELGNYKNDVITTITILKVLDRPEDAYEDLPRKISVYSSSTLQLGPIYSDIPAAFWYFNGKRLTNKKPYLELSSKHFRLTTRNSGFVQADVIFGKISYTASVFVQFIDDDIQEETIPARSDIHVHCVPPATYSLPDIILEFSESCGANIVNNTIIITRETAWRHDICSCKARGYSYSVERKFDLEFDGAMFSIDDRWEWSQWSPWSDCPNMQELCGQNLFTSRRRTCKKPTSLDGEYCSGSNKQKQQCPFIPCRKKVTSFWAPWSIWSHCSNPCGAGTQSRRRICIAPSEGPCPEGEWHEAKKCVGSVCYAENWGEWSKWSECSKSCGIGTRMRRRQCPGQRCLGRSKDHKHCQTPCVQPSEESVAKEIYSKGILYLPNTVAFGSAIFLIVLAISMAIHNCRKKFLKRSNHKRLLQDLFNKADSDVERQPLLETDTQTPPAKKRAPSAKQGNMATRTQPKNIARFKHKSDSKSKKRSASPGKESSSSLAPETPPGNLPPPPSLLAPSGGIVSASSAGGIVPPPPPVPVRGVGPPPPPPPPPPPGSKR